MSFPTYPSYKEVPIPWIQSIPEHWEWKPVLGAAKERDEDNRGMKEDNLLSLSYGKIVNKDINTSDGLLPESFETYQIVRPGDIVLRLTDLQNDKRSLRSALVTQTGIITSAYLALEAKAIDPEYLSYLLRAYDVSKVFYSMGGGLRQSMKYGDVKRMPLVIPTQTEQLAIASFLDRETAKIDALIAEQQRLIELLQEKRQAVISHAVTKGLNPNAPMKDSGVEWLGEVPEHWDVKSLKHLVQMKSGDFITSDSIEPEGAYPVFGGNGLRGFTDSFNREGSYALIGRQGALCGNINTASGKFWASEHAIVCVHESEACLDWLCKMLEAANLNQYSTSAAQPGLSVEVIGNTKVPCPPPSEQIDIGAWMDQELSKMDATIETSSHLVTVLGERRSALISAAVTGQIDVRGLAQGGEP